MTIRVSSLVTAHEISNNIGRIEKSFKEKQGGGETCGIDGI